MASAPSGVINFSSLTLTLVYRCNYRCPSCLVGDKLTSRDCITYDEAVGLIDAAADLETYHQVSFVGGEPFLVYPLMVQISKYVHQKYDVPITISTNSFWAKSVQTARAKLEPLAEFGVSALLLSWDDFHALFGKLSQVANAIIACREFGIRPTIQNIVVKDSTSLDSIRTALEGMCDTSEVKWVENPCIPVGLGAAIENEKHQSIDVDDLPYGRCTAGTVLNVQANGDVKPCCGAGLMANSLTMGNIRNQGLSEVVKKASVDPVLNSLIGYKGPKDMIRRLRENGRSDLVPISVTDVCDACHKIMENDEALQLLQQTMEIDKVKLLLERVASEEFSGHRGTDLELGEEGSIFSKVPNIDFAHSLAAVEPKGSSSSALTGLVNDLVTKEQPFLFSIEELNCAKFFKKWRDPEYLSKLNGDEIIDVTHGRLMDETFVKRHRFSEFIHEISTEKEHDLRRPRYFRFNDIPDKMQPDLSEFIEFLRDASDMRISRTSQFENRPTELLKTFIGQRTYTDSHEHVVYDSFLVQVCGTKEVLLHKPSSENLEALYVGEHANWSPVRMFNPDLDKFPKFLSNDPVLVRVQPGQVLYIPIHWFHAVASNSFGMNITLSYFFQPKQGFQQLRPNGNEREMFIS